MRWIAVIALLFVSSGSVSAAEPPPLEAFAEFDDISSVDISPNGDRLVMLAGTDHGNRFALVHALSTGESKPIPLGEGFVMGVSWLSDVFIQVVFADRRMVDAGDDRTDVRRTLILNVDTVEYYELSSYAEIVSIVPERPDEIIVELPVLRDDRNTMAANLSNEDAIGFTTGIFRHQLGDRRSRRRIDIGNQDTSYYRLGTSHEPVIRVDFDDESYEIDVYARLGDTHRWTHIHDEKLTIERYGRRGKRYLGTISNVLGMDRNGREAWFWQRVDDNRTVLRTIDLETRELTDRVIASPVADVYTALIDWRDNAVIGASWHEGEPNIVYFDPEFAELHATLEQMFPDDEVSLSSWDLAFNRVVVYIEGDTTPGDYYLLDRGEGAMSLIASRRRGLGPEHVNPVEVVHYTARDGLEIMAYLTLPRDRDPSDLPLVVMPHGGPEARDYFGFDEWSQLLASYGYAVLQPQFRGSDGFGRDFVRLGHGEFGGKMVADVADGALALVERGIVAPDRICIWGWSYGGYQALANPAMFPDLYRCAIAGAAVSDLPSMMRYAETRHDGAAVDYWSEYITDWRVNRDHLIDISPTTHAARIEAPILLIHGTDDLIVPYQQAEAMAEALRAAGKPYELVAIEDGVHHSYRMTYDQKLQLYRALIGFLQRHNPPD
ncbi:S9 family peptidase [Marinicauda algicola]|uniref:S9 family peptidase n=1 Tax=Marinicauda algicola TaxID=2029849 RepID=A0A4S2GYF2_9PROT|nr:S9 family peptidase [Marinicauda algicola]TGY88124.1 S9 family peptidase [Marinicauda algicola]